MMRTPSRTSPRTRRVSVATVVAALLGAALSGCSFSWDDSGIKDISLGGRNPAGIVKGDASKPASTNADAAVNAEEARAAADAAKADAAAKAAAEEAESRKLIRKVAILPVAYRDAAGGGVPCDLCPPSVQMKPTSALSARLTTGFIYEAVARHPRLVFPTPEVVDKSMAASGQSMRAAAASLASAGRADFVVAAALIELRPRIGSDQAPEKTAGVALYVSLVDARTGKVKWSDTFDEDESGRGFVMRTYDKISNDKPIRFHTAEGFSEHAVDTLIKPLVKQLD